MVFLWLCIFGYRISIGNYFVLVFFDSMFYGLEGIFSGNCTDFLRVFKDVWQILN